MSGELAGRLGERVTLWTPVPDRDALGGWTGGWTVLASAWAMVEPEGRGARAWRVTLRAPSAVKPGDRIGWGAATLRVRAVLRDPETPERVTAMAEEEQA